MTDLLQNTAVPSVDQQVDVQIKALEERMISQYRNENADTERVIREYLADARARFADARIRTFLPILIERAVHARMRLELPA